MVFNSYEFVLLFMPIFLILFYLVRNSGIKKGNEKLFCELLVVMGSLAFFIPFGAKNVAVLGISVVWNICTAIPMSFMRDQNVRIRAFGREVYPHKIWLAMGVCGNLILLLFFKLWGVFLPIAISFYTFNQISYIVDLYRGKVTEFKLLDYLTYVLFFPKLLQGPLMGYEDFQKEMDRACGVDKMVEAGSYFDEKNECSTKVRSKKLDYEVLLRGLLLFSLGLFKKVILADTFGKAVDSSFAVIADAIGRGAVAGTGMLGLGIDVDLGMGSLEAILTAVFYSFQLYFDFSGYCDMATAICMVMGFDLPLNFNSPYKAVNIADFWKRWHISLTKFFTKYVYIPLGGNRRGAAKMYVNFMIVFLLSGFWHGTGWTFIIWGAMHGVMYVIDRAVMKCGEPKNASDTMHSKKDIAENNGHCSVKRNDCELDECNKGDSLGTNIFHAIRVALTFIYVTAAWVFFRADTAVQALSLFRQMVAGGSRALSSNFTAGFRLDELWYVIKVTPVMKLSISWDVPMWLFLACASVIIFFGKTAIDYTKSCKIGIKTTLLTALLLVWCVLSFGGVSTFLYMNF